MIGSLRGKVIEVTADSALVEAGGVGYEIAASLGTLAELSVKVGTEVFLLAYTHVREDALQVFGFSDKTEKSLFLSLLKVNGIGPKMALNILSGERPERIHAMIEAGDVKALSKFPKVGKKTAEQMILTLKGKLVLSDSVTSEAVNNVAGPRKELTSALVNLGFRLQDVEQVVGEMPPDVDLQEGIRRGLFALSSL